MQLTSKFSKRLKFSLCLIDIYFKFGWVIPLKDEISGNTNLATTLHEKPYFSGPGISWKAQRDQVHITFRSIFSLKKRPCFPSPKTSKQELFGSPKQELLSNQ